MMREDEWMGVVSSRMWREEEGGGGARGSWGREGTRVRGVGVRWREPKPSGWSKRYRVLGP
jgi:hypothetical protein